MRKKKKESVVDKSRRNFYVCTYKFYTSLKNYRMHIHSIDIKY